MKLRYIILIAVSFVAGFMQAALDMSLDEHWELPIAVALAVFLVYLGKYPKQVQSEAKFEIKLRSLFPNSLKMQTAIGKEALEKFEEPAENVVHIPNTDSSSSRPLEL
jgi:hypothetical protein